MTGRLLTCEVGRNSMRVAVVGPLSDEMRTALGASSGDDEEFRIIPGAMLVTFPPETGAQYLDQLKQPPLRRA
jgi:hypothetical protein